MALIKDITERKEAEKQRLKMEARIRDAQKMESLGALAGGSAHDFNNNLAAILGYTELAQLECPAGSLSKQIKTADSSSSLRSRVAWPCVFFTEGSSLTVREFLSVPGPAGQWIKVLDPKYHPPGNRRS